MKALRPCLTCGTPTNSTRCPPCHRQRETTLYGGQHQAERRAWQPAVNAGTTCAIPECTHPTDPIDPQAWDLDHRTRQPAHPDCNRRAGAQGHG